MDFRAPGNLTEVRVALGSTEVEQARYPLGGSLQGGDIGIGADPDLLPE